MRSRVIRDQRQRQAYAAHEVIRQVYRYITRNETVEPKIRFQAQLALNKYPLNTSLTHIHNRCIDTGRGRGILSEFRLCRTQFRIKALRGDIPGVTKYAW
ncbi:40S ribosomal protein mrp2, mitochondrial [Tieghemiomyces parasiticus]|uniref:40S ribosomal protein mrp2, mitochondrial n=1 Tax=Tieghemiomyces parasiticus TaxID=78921 RepID=A0A9W8DSH1_9FUNG|nr:40S ribosomal protein mrp2, mitochondrial [Tieghemiomyces parasiticus]KAJ1916500.1 40S ribosomal protein mrp2, mitochondrial [Tieghemiomyces parasiticus]